VGLIRTAVRGFGRIPPSTLSDRDPVSPVRVESAAGSLRVDGRYAWDILSQHESSLVRTAILDVLVLPKQRVLLLCLVDGTPF
jgi:hypothetical protein